MCLSFLSPSLRPASRYFTLVEMLVVIAILSILSALLVPALRNASEFAQRISCFDHQKQQGAAFLIFAEENGGNLPQLRNHSAYGGGEPYWYSLIEPGLGGSYSGSGAYKGKRPSAFSCPSETNHYGGFIDYGPNGLYITVGNGLTPYYGQSTPPGFVSLSSVRSPSSVTLLVDAKRSTGDSGYWSVHTEDMRQKGIATTPYEKAWPPRHGEGMNWLFFDQHVEWLSASTMISYDQIMRNRLFGYPVP